MVAAPALGTQAASLVRLGVANRDVRFQLACRVGFQRCEEIALIVLVVLIVLVFLFVLLTLVDLIVLVLLVSFVVLVVRIPLVILV